MTKRFRRILGISSILILAPILYAIQVYDALPAQMAIHFNLQNQADQWLAKPGVVFGLPILMLLAQWICVGATMVQQKSNSTAPRFERVIYSIIPILNVVVYLTTLAFNLGGKPDIRRIVLLLIGLIFVAVGNYLPTIPASASNMTHWPKQPAQQVAQRLNRRLGYYFVVAGVVLWLSLFFQPVVSAISLGILLLGLVFFLAVTFLTVK
jgi:uncharacterized membrane protein